MKFDATAITEAMMESDRRRKTSLPRDLRFICEPPSGGLGEIFDELSSQETIPSLRADKHSSYRLKSIHYLVSRFRKDLRYESDDNAVNLVVGDPENSLVTICAHYDVVPGSMGYNDNGSSCAVLIGLCERHVGDPNFCFVFLGREESGFYGSALHFSKYRPHLTINLDVIGDGENIVFHNNAVEGPLRYPLNAMLEQMALERGAIRTDRLPVCDTDMIIHHGLDVITFSAFPDKDADYIRKTGHLACSEVIKYMHCGVYDDLEYVSLETMEKVELLLDDFIIAFNCAIKARPEMMETLSIHRDTLYAMGIPC